MRKHLILIAIWGVLLGSFHYPIYSQEPTATTSGILDSDVQELKDKVADKVEELKDKIRKAVSGIVQKSANDRITIINGDNTNVEVEIDETLTSFYDIVGTKIKEISLKEIIKGDYIFVTGPEIGETVTANAVYKDTQYLVFSGKITEVDSEKFTIKIVTVDKSNYVLDVERTTKQKLLDIKTLKTTAIGFSKLKEGDSVHVVAKSDPKVPNQTQFSAVKVLVIPNEYFLQ